MERHPIGDVTETSFSKIKEMIDVNTVIGNPITTPDGTTIIPVSKVSFGFGSGGLDMPPAAGEQKFSLGMSAGSGAGVKIEPVGFLTVCDGVVKMIGIPSPANTTVDRLVELIPEIADKVQELIEKNKKKKEEE